LYPNNYLPIWLINYSIFCNKAKLLSYYLALKAIIRQQQIK